MTDVVVMGVGIHPFGRFDTGYEEPGAHAATAALKGAGGNCAITILQC